MIEREAKPDTAGAPPEVERAVVRARDEDTSIFDRAAAALDGVRARVGDGADYVAKRSLESAIGRARLFVATTQATLVARRDAAAEELEACERDLAAADPKAVAAGVELTKRRSKARQAVRDIAAQIAAVERTTTRLDIQLRFLDKAPTLSVARFLADDDRAYHAIVTTATEQEFGFVSLLPTLEAAIGSGVASATDGEAASDTAPASDGSVDAVAGEGEVAQVAPGEVQRTSQTTDARAGKLELERILETGTLADVTAARDGLRAAAPAHGARAELPAEVHVQFRCGDKPYDLAVSRAVADAFVPAFAARVDRLAGTAPAPEWQAFATAFNGHFKPILHAFDLGVGAGEGVSAERLQFLFTTAQRDALTQFMTTNTIPEQLFDADGSSRATAGQRILIASKILADGTYVVGSRVQRVHALMCFHWAQLVYQYAGVQTAGLNDNNVTGSFDFQGNVLVAGDVATEGKESRDHAQSPSAAHAQKTDSAYRNTARPWDELANLQPGDWLYTYTGNATSSGQHSVIFAGWADGAKTYKPDTDKPETFHYRRAFTYDQGAPEQGGQRHSIFIADELFIPDGEKVWTRPVTRWYRVNEDAAPADSVAELAPAARALGKDDLAYLRDKGKQAGGEISVDKLAAWIRQDNATLAGKLTDRLSASQRDMLDAANASSDLHVLCALHQRLLILIRLASKRDAMLAAQEDSLVQKLATAPLDDDAQLADIGKMIDYSQRITEVTTEVEPLEDRLAAIDSSDELAELKRERQALVAEKRKAEPDRRDAIDVELAALATRREALTQDQATHKKELRELHRTIASLHHKQATLRGLVDSVEKRVLKRDVKAEAAGESLVPGRSKSPVSFGNGAVRSLEASGLDIPWSALVDGSTAE